MPVLVYFSAAFVVGILAAAQPSINGMLGKALESPLKASVVSFFVGVSVMSLVALGSGAGLPSPRQVAAQPWWMWLLGGTLGAAFVTTALIVVPRIGPALFFGLLVLGQMVASILFEHFGFLTDKQPANLAKVLGAALILAGVALIQAQRP